MGRGKNDVDLLPLEVERFAVDDTAASLAEHGDRLTRTAIEQLQGFASELDQVASPTPYAQAQEEGQEDERFMEALLENRSRWLPLAEQDPQVKEALDHALCSFAEFALRRTLQGEVATLEEWLNLCLSAPHLDFDINGAAQPITAEEMELLYERLVAKLSDELRDYEDQQFSERRLTDLAGFLQVEALNARLSAISLISADRLLALPDNQERRARIVTTPELREAVEQEYEQFDGDEWFGREALADMMETAFYHTGRVEGDESLSLFEAHMVGKVFPLVICDFRQKAIERINSNKEKAETVTRLMNMTAIWERHYAEWCFRQDG